MNDKLVLVVGKTGQVARELIRTVPQTGFSAVAIGRPELDIADAAAIEKVVGEVRPNYIVNAAAYTAVDQAETDAQAAFVLNAEAPGNLAAAAARIGCPFLHISTDYVFDGQTRRPYREEDPVSPLGVYGKSKLAGEQRVAERNVQHIILRTAWVYSPFGKNFIKTMLRLASTRDEIGVVSDQIGNPTAASEIAAGIWSIIDTVTSAPDEIRLGLFHMTASGEASWADLAEAAFEFSAARGGPSAKVRRITTAEFPTPVRRPADSRLDCSKLADTYRVALPSWEQSLERCVAELIETEGWQE